MTAIRVLLTGALALVLAAVPSVAAATLTMASAAAVAVSSDTLVAPTGISVKCPGSAQRAVISWTATLDTYASGYVVYVSSSGSEYSESVAGGATTSYNPIVAVPTGSTVTLVSVYRSWTSVRSVSATAPSSCH